MWAQINSRIMVDRSTFKRQQPYHVFPVIQKVLEDPLTEEEYILASPVVYGFSLTDKMWRKHAFFL